MRLDLLSKITSMHYHVDRIGKNCSFVLFCFSSNHKTSIIVIKKMFSKRARANADFEARRPGEISLRNGEVRSILLICICISKIVVSMFDSFYCKDYSNRQAQRDR